MVLIDENKAITMSRGDTIIVPCYFKNTRLAPADGTVAVFTLKRDYDDEDKLLEKKYYIVGGRFNLEFDHTDTNWLKNDVTYYYDIQLRYHDGQIYTLIPPTKFKIKGVVSDVDT